VSAWRWIVTAIMAATVLALWGVPWWRRLREQRLRGRPPDPADAPLLATSVPHYERLPPSLRTALHGHMQVLLATKRYVGLNGVRLTDRHRKIIAGTAALPLCGVPNARPYPRLSSFLIYPEPFVVETADALAGGFELHGPEVREGESWTTGQLILNWREIETNLRRPEDGHNVILHELAHQLDAENGYLDDLPAIRDRDLRRRWQAAFAHAFEVLANATERGRTCALDPYGLEDEGELFAVAVEAFFLRPAAVRRTLPELYAVMAAYFQLDPAAWPALVAASNK